MHLDTQNLKVVYIKSCKQLKYILIVNHDAKITAVSKNNDTATFF
jgi:hypothetical protein